MTGYREFLKKFIAAAHQNVRNDEGGAIAEMAFSTILIMTMFVAIFQLSLACYSYNSVTEAARESARWAMVRGSMCSTYTPTQTNCGASSTDIQNYAKSAVAIDWSACTNSKPCVTASWSKATTVTGVQQATTTWTSCSNQCNNPGNLVIVNVSYPYTFNIPFVNKFPITLKSQAGMIISQ
jgi:Flp pilus assembly protein TadG